jgi:hypothetical protein
MAHPICTGIISAGIVYAVAKKSKNSFTRVSILASKVTVSIILHSLWN